MSGLRGMFAGVLALVALEALVTTTGAAERTAGLLGTVAQLVTRLLDPNVAAIPNRAGINSAPQIMFGPSSASTMPPANGKPRPPQLAAPAPAPIGGP